VTIARILSGLGRALVAAGVLLLLFVAFQLWGTGLRTAQAQDRLEEEFERRLAEVSATDGAAADTTTPTEVPPVDPAVTEPPVQDGPADPADLPPPVDGDPLGRIRIEAIGVDFTFVEGDSLLRLQDGPGHFPSTPLPGQPGNAALAGHRTTFLAPFHRLDELVEGDVIEVTTLQGRFRYEVLAQPPAYEGAEPLGHFIVQPEDVWILDPTEENLLTLMACHPKYSAAQRIVVRAALVGAPAPETPRPGPVEGEDDLPSELLTNEPAAKGPALAYSAATLGLWAAAWAVARRWRAWRSWRWWATYAVALAPFAVLLYLTFEQLSRLFPAGY
jgi:sortase A